MIRVIGDIMLDRWIIGSADRMSPEAPVPVLKEDHQEYSVGGAGNLALNLANLNVELSLYAAVSKDKEGYKIIELLKDFNTLNSNITFDNTVTTTKTRLVGQGGQHIMRWDREDKYQGNLKQTINLDSDYYVISDYNKGVIDLELMNSLKNKKVFVDPKQMPQMYRDCFVLNQICPNIVHGLVNLILKRPREKS